MNHPDLAAVPTDDVSSELARLRELDTARDQLSERLNHAFSNPLNVIIGFADLLASSDLSEEQRDDAREIVDAARRLASLAAEALQAPRLWAPAPSPTSVRVSDLVAEALRDLQLGATDHLVTLSIDDEETLETDRARLIRALAESIAALLHHASEDAGVAIVSSREDDCINITMTRSPGAGVRGEALLAPFESRGRIGLGLACARAIVRSVGGRLTIEEAPSAQPAVTITLPRRVAGEGAFR